MAKVQHTALTDPNLHEPKGISSASARDVYVADGAGTGVWRMPLRMGSWYYNDLTTASSAIALTSASTDYELTNDGDGASSVFDYRLTEIVDIWNTSTNRFDFSGLSLGDAVDIRVDVEVTTTGANTAVECHLELGVGGTAVLIPFLTDSNIKSTGAHKISRNISVLIDSNNVKNNPARILMRADGTGATVKVVGFYVRVIRMQE